MIEPAQSTPNTTSATSTSSEMTAEALLEAGVSQLSLSTSSNQTVEDWDKSLMLENAGPGSSSSRPSTPTRPGSQGKASRLLSTMSGEKKNSLGTKTRRSLSDLLRRHAEKGRELKLSDEDEERLSEELGNWINSDSSPYELDDSPAEGDSPKRRTNTSAEDDDDDEDNHHGTPPTES